GLPRGAPLRAYQAYADRDVRDRCRGYFPQAGNLHAIPLQRTAMLRDHHQGHLASAAFQFADEAIQFIEQALRPDVEGRRAAAAISSRLAIAIVQGYGVV